MSQELPEPIPLRPPPRYLLSAPQKEIRLHSPVEQTVRRSGGSQEEGAWGEVRLKMILENRRLKCSLEQLRRQFDSHREGEGKIAEVLRESQAKLTDYRTRIRHKDARIAHLIQQTNAHQQQLTALQQKNNHLQAYSDWQETQIRQLQQEQTQLRQCHLRETQASRKDQIYNPLQRYTGEHTLLPSMQSLEEKDERWVSVGDMGAGELEGFKQKRVTEEDYDLLAEAHHAVSSRVAELEREAETAKAAAEARVVEWKQLQSQMKRREEEWSGKMEQLKLKEQQSRVQMQQRERAIEQLQQQMDKLQKKQESEEYGVSEQAHQLQNSIAILQRELQSKESLIAKLKDRLQEQDQQFRRELHELSDQLTHEEEKLQRVNALAAEQQTAAQLKITTLEKVIENATVRVEEADSHREELEERLAHALQQRDKMTKLAEQLENESEWLPKIEEAESYIRMLEEERQSQHDQMERYAAQIRQLKIEISELNRDKHDNSRENRQRTIPEQHESSLEEDGFYEEAIQQKAPLQNQMTAKQRKSRSRTLPQQEELQIEADNRNEQEQKDRTKEERGRQKEEKRKQQEERNRQLEKMQEQIERVKQEFSKEMEEQTHRHNIATIDLKFKLEKEQQDSAILAKTLSEQQAKLKEVEAERTELKQLIANLIQEQKLQTTNQQQLANLHQNLQEKNSQIQLCNVQMAAMEEKLKKSKDQWKAAQERMNILQSITTHQKEQIEKEQLNRREQTLARQKLQSTFEDKQQEIVKLLLIISQIKNELHQLEMENQQLIAQRDALEHTDATLRLEIASLDEDKAELQNNIKILEGRVENQEAIMKSLEDRIKIQEEQIIVVQTQLDQSNAKFAELQKQKQILTEQGAKREQIERRLQEKQRSLKQLRSDLANLKESLEFSNTQRDQASPMHSSQNSLTLQIQDATDPPINLIKSQIASIQAKHRSLTQQFEGRNRNLLTAKAQLQRKVNEQQGKNDNLAKIINNYETTLQQMQKQLEIQKQNEDKMKREMQSILRELEEYANKSEQMSIQIDMKNRKIVEFEKERQQMMAQNKKMQEQIARQSQQMTQQVALLDQMQIEIAKYKQFNQKTSAQSQSLQNTISSLQKVLKQREQELKLSREQQQAIKIILLSKEKEQLGILQGFQSERIQFKQDLQITKKLMGELQQEYDLKINKLSRELAHSKLLLQQSLQESTSQLELSNRSVSSVRTELQLAHSALSNKQMENKQLKDANYQLKEQAERNSREKDENNALMQRMQAERDRGKQNLQKAQVQIKELNSKLQTNLQQLLKQTQQGTVYQIENSHLSEQIQHLQTTIESQATSNHELRLQLAQLTTSLQKLESSAQSANQKYTAVEEQLLMAQVNEKRMQREYETRIEDICLEQRQQLLEVERRQSKEAENAAAEIARISKEEAKFKMEVEVLKSKTEEYKIQVDGLKQELQRLTTEENKLKDEVNSLKNELGGVRNELGAVVQKERKDELELKASQNERGELTDRMLQLAQQNNELNEVIQNLRNDAISKSNQIFECRELIEKLQEDMQARVAGSPLEAKLTEAYQFIDRLSQTNQQLKMKEDVLQAQLREKAKVERQLHEKLEATRPKENRDRGSSGDSWVSRSKIFTDEKSQNLHAELQDTKLKLQSAQAYIIQLEDECQKLAQNQDPQNKPLMEKRSKQLQVENDDLKIKVEYLEAYLEQLETFNLKSSVKSRRSAYSRKDEGKKEESNNKQESSKRDESSRKEVSVDKLNRNNGGRISLLIDFVQNYSKEVSCGERQEELRRQLEDPLLQELLSTIFYRLEKESGQNADYKTLLADLEEELHAAHDELNHLRDSEAVLTEKAKRSEALERQLEKSEHQLQDLVLAKMQQEAELAQKRASLQELQNRLGRLNSKEEQRAGKRDKDTLQILEQQDESQSDSMMSESADSQIPSSVNQSKQFKSSVDFRTRPPNHLTLSKGLVRTKSLNITDDKQSVQFLKRCLNQVEAIEQQATSLSREIEQMRGGGHSGLLAKLEEVEAKVRMSDRDLKQHLERSQSELAALVRELLKQRQEQDQYGLQTDSRKRIQECLSALQQQLTRSGKFGEEQARSHEPRRSTSPSRLKQSLQEIKQDVANEDRGSSIVTPRGQIMHQQSFTNSEGFNQTGEAAELRQGYNELMKELHLTHDELVTKEELLRSTNQRYAYAEVEIAAVLDQLRNNFDEDQYLFDQAEKIKAFLSKAREQPSFHGEGRGSGSITILVESNRKIEKERGKQKEKQKDKEKSKQQEKQRENALYVVVRVDQGELRSWASGVGSQQLRQLIGKLQSMLQQRFEECMQFLSMEKSLIGEILKVGSDQQALEQHLARLAGRLTRQEISDIITNSHNRLQAHRTLTRILHDDAPSHVSNEHDFAPSGDRLQAIRNAVFPRPSELTLALHNQLLALLAAPTRHLFYEHAEGFYRLLRDFEERTLREAERERSASEQQSQRLEELLGEGLSGVDFEELEKFQRLQVKTQKLRSSSCGIGVAERSD